MTDREMRMGKARHDQEGLESPCDLRGSRCESGQGWGRSDRR